MSAYSAVGIVLAAHFNLIDGDGPSRVANAGYVVFSRYPHLGAIGFVWNPLPSLVEIPLLLFSPLWPELKTLGLAGVFQSALFMAGAVVVVNGIGRDLRVPRIWRWLAVAGFACNPMIVLYGAVGLSEAALVFCTMWAVRRILRWLDSGSVTDLAAAGFGLAAGYLARYEAAIAIAGATAVVMAITWWRERGGQGARRPIADAFHDGIIIALPGALVVVAWALTAWLLIGEPFPQSTSQYGNSSQLEMAARANGGSAVDLHNLGEVLAARILGMSPLLVPVLAVAIVLAVQRRRPGIAVPVAIFGSVLAFQIVALLIGSTFGWFRFFIFAIPLTTVAMLLWWPQSARTGGVVGEAAELLPGAAMAVVVAVSIPVTWGAMLDPAVGNQSVQYGLNSIVSPDTYPPDQRYYFRFMQDDRAIAAWLDSQNLPEGSVLSDTFQSWGIWLASEKPEQFVITSDYDYRAALNDPAGHGVRYILVSNPGTSVGVDAINSRYPTLWDDGAELGHRVLSVTGSTGEVRWRVYAVGE